MTRRRGPLAMLGVTAAITVTTRSGFWLACWALALGVGLIGAYLARCWRDSPRPPELAPDGEPLTDEEWAALAGIHLATDALNVPEPVYPRQDGAR